MSAVRLAVPAGDLRAPTGELLLRAGIEAREYAEGSRLYHFTVDMPPARIRVFREKDIPIQVALGAYDLGICGGTWIAESHVAYPNDDIVPLRPVGFGRQRLYAAVSAGAGSPPFGRPVRLAGEYPNIAEAFALSSRFPDFRVLPLHGAAEAYPPEDADIAIVVADDDGELAAQGLRALHGVYEGGAWLVANRRALSERDLASVLRPLLAALPPYADEPGLDLKLPRAASAGNGPATTGRDYVRLAVPDGHQQRHAFASLEAAGLRFEGYGESSWVRRPRSGVEGLEVKVIRPQDMPQQVALGSFDLAITGRDWLTDHLYAFPASPVEEAVDLGRAGYSLAAVVPDSIPATTIEEALSLWSERTVRIASEYVNTADHYARLRRIPRYSVIPINGASEGFLPDDADILIEGSETGATLRANKLKAIDKFFASTSCLIRSKRPVSGRRAALMAELIERFQRAAVADRVVSG